MKSPLSHTTRLSKSAKWRVELICCLCLEYKCVHITDVEHNKLYEEEEDLKSFIKAQSNCAAMCSLLQSVLFMNP